MEEVMRKYLVLMFFLLFFIGMIQQKQQHHIMYEIHYDSNNKADYAIKAHIQKNFNELTSGLKTECYETMICDNVELFAYENCHVYYKHKLIVIEGDGKGKKIEGELLSYQTCMPEVKPKSLIVDLIDN